MVVSQGIIDGRKLSESLTPELAKKVNLLKEKFGVHPSLHVILIGSNSASQIYVKNKQKKAKSIGILSEISSFDERISQEELLRIIKKLNEDDKVHGILVQLPLPTHINQNAIINSISPTKDVDGFHPENIGKMVTKQQNTLIPCTPKGCIKLIKTVEKDLSGMRALVVGRSNIVGKPMSQLLLQENCTTTIAHIHTRNLQDECKSADVLVVATGNPGLIPGHWIKKGAIVIDVGINRVGNKIVGDVIFSEAKDIAKAITPVPGGVGPMTIHCLLENTLQAACMAVGMNL